MVGDLSLALEWWKKKKKHHEWWKKRAGISEIVLISVTHLSPTRFNWLSRRSENAATETEETPHATANGAWLLRARQCR
jgi:hypothetical protein